MPEQSAAEPSAIAGAPRWAAEPSAVAGGPAWAAEPSAVAGGSAALFGYPAEPGSTAVAQLRNSSPAERRQHIRDLIDRSVGDLLPG